MKKKISLQSPFLNKRNLLNKSMLALIKGGTANADDYELCIIKIVGTSLETCASGRNIAHAECA